MQTPLPSLLATASLSPAGFVPVEPRAAEVEPARGSGAIRNIAVKRSAPPRARPTDPLAAANVKKALKNRYEH
jgi:hypothetical protein